VARARSALESAAGAAGLDRGCSSLTELDLRANELETLPEGLAELPALETLDLRWTKLVGGAASLARVRT